MVVKVLVCEAIIVIGNTFLSTACSGLVCEWAGRGRVGKRFFRVRAGPGYHFELPGRARASKHLKVPGRGRAVF